MAAQPRAETDQRDPNESQCAWFGHHGGTEVDVGVRALGKCCVDRYGSEPVGVIEEVARLIATGIRTKLQSGCGFKITRHGCEADEIRNDASQLGEAQQTIDIGLTAGCTGRGVL